MKGQKTQIDAIVVSRDLDSKVVQLKALMENIDQAEKTLMEMSSQIDYYTRRQQELIKQCDNHQQQMDEFKKQQEMMTDEIMALDLKRIEMTDVMTGLQVSIMDTTNQIDISKQELQKQTLLYQQKEKDLGLKYEKSVKLYMDKLEDKKKESEELEHFINTIHRNTQLGLFEMIRCRDEIITMNFSGKLITMPREFYQNFPLLIDIWNQRTMCPRDRDGNPYVLLSPDLIQSLTEWFLTDNIKYNNIDDGIGMLQLLGQLGNAVLMDGDICCLDKFTNGYKLYERVYGRVVNDYIKIIKHCKPLPDLWMIYVFYSDTPINFTIVTKDDDSHGNNQASMIIYAGRFIDIEHPKPSQHDFSHLLFNYECSDGSIIYGDEKQQHKINNIVNFSVPNDQTIECYLHKHSLFLDKTEKHVDLDNCFLTGWDDISTNETVKIGMYLGHLVKPSVIVPPPRYPYSSVKSSYVAGYGSTSAGLEKQKLIASSAKLLPVNKDDIKITGWDSTYSLAGSQWDDPSFIPPPRGRDLIKKRMIKELKIDVPDHNEENLMDMKDVDGSDDEDDYQLSLAKKASLKDKLSMAKKAMEDIDDDDNGYEDLKKAFGEDDDQDVVLAGDPIFKIKDDEFEDESEDKEVPVHKESSKNDKIDSIQHRGKLIRGRIDNRKKESESIKSNKRPVYDLGLPKTQLL